MFTSIPCSKVLPFTTRSFSELVNKVSQSKYIHQNVNLDNVHKNGIIHRKRTPTDLVETNATICTKYMF